MINSNLIQRPLWILAVLLMATGAQAQSSQKGYTKTRGRMDASGKVIPGSRLSDVSVILQGDNSTVSDADGNFSLLVSSNNFYLKNVRKTGYVLSDPDVLSKQYACSPNALIIVMETPGDQADDKLAVERRIRRTLQRQLQEREDELEALKAREALTQEEYRQALQKLYDEQENDEKLISEMAERYSRMDFDQVDEFQREISACILNGELSKADSLLNTRGDIDVAIAEYHRLQGMNAKEKEELARRQGLLEQSVAYEQWQLEDIAQRCFNKFEIFKMQHQLDSAAYYIEKRADLDLMNIQWQLEAGDFIGQFCGDYQKDSTILGRGLNNAMKHYGENSPEVVGCYTMIGDMYNYQRKWSKSKKYHLKALKIRKRINDKDFFGMAMNYSGLASALSGLGQYDSSLTNAMKSIALLESLYGEKHQDIATNYLHIASVYIHLSEYEKSLDYNGRAEKIYLGLFGDNVHYLGACYNNKGYLLMQLGQIDSAATYYKKALEIFDHNYMNGHSDRMLTLMNIASIAYLQGKYDDALSYFMEILDFSQQKFGEEHEVTAGAYNNIATVMDKQRKSFDKVLEYFKKSVQIHIKLLGEMHPSTATGYDNIGNTLREMGDYSQAMEYLLKALNIRRDFFGENHPAVATSYRNVGAVYFEQKDYEHAFQYIYKAIQIAEAIFGDNHPDVASGYNNLAAVLVESGNFQQAVSMYMKVIAIRRVIFGEYHPGVAQAYMNLSHCYESMQDTVNAEIYRQKANEIKAKLQNQ